MSYVDVIFPLNLPPLTYRCPDHLAASARPGMIVSAPLRTTTAFGMILRKASPPPRGKIRAITQIIGDAPAAGEPLLGLITWMADYYIASEGIVLKYTIPDEIFPVSRSVAPRPLKQAESSFRPNEISEKGLTDVFHALQCREYRGFLIRASSRYQYSLALTAAARAPRGTIILLPEINRAESLYRVAREQFGSRVCLYHSDLPKPNRRAVIHGIRDGEFNIVIGTRSALFVPLSHVSLIMVTDEGSSSYCVDEGFQYHVRDVAVMRGYLENCAVVLSATAPSADSAANALSGKYSLIVPETATTRPAVTVVNERSEKKAAHGLTAVVLQAVQGALRHGRKVLVLVNRKGYAPLIVCRECGHTEECPDCRIPVVMYRRSHGKCRYCGRTFTVPEQCSRCSGHNLELVGSGTERIQETLETFYGIGSVRVDKDAAGKHSEMNHLLETIAKNPANVAIGTKMLIKNLAIDDAFDLAVVLHADAALSVPDFRASEKAYIELSSLIDLVGGNGQVFIQTRKPDLPLYRYLKANRYDDFIREELSLRKTLHYPPYTRLLVIRHRGGDACSNKILETIAASNANIDILGPAAFRDKKGREEHLIMLKHQSRKVLNSAARVVLERYGKEKNFGITVDVDPA